MFGTLACTVWAGEGTAATVLEQTTTSGLTTSGLNLGALAPAAAVTALQTQIAQWATQYAQRAAGDSPAVAPSAIPPATSAATPASSASASSAAGVRVQVDIGQFDPRLHLAPCQKISAYVPPGLPLWGRTRVGLRCDLGEKRWNVFLPVTVHVWAAGLVAVNMLPPGATLQAGDVRQFDVDLAGENSPAMRRAADVVGRQLVKAIQPGESLRQAHLRARRWFAAGDPVDLVIHGEGFTAKADATAITDGDEDHCARVRTSAGRLVCGQAVGDHQVEIGL